MQVKINLFNIIVFFFFVNLNHNVYVIASIHFLPDVLGILKYVLYSSCIAIKHDSN